MEIRNIATFVKIVEYNNFTKAAESLGYSQAAVTAQIKSLEKELGIPLFDRIGRVIRPDRPRHRFDRRGKNISALCTGRTERGRSREKQCPANERTCRNTSDMLAFLFR